VGLFKKLFSRASPVSAARTWLSNASERDFEWADLGELALPSGGIFVGDPTGGHDYHMRATATVEVQALHVWAFHSGAERPDFEARTNTLIWLEASGAQPATRGLSLDFGVDAACLAFGDLETGHAFTRLSDIEYEAGRGDNFAWLMPYIQELPHYAGWADIPPEGLRMFIASTGNDGGFAASWLHDAQGGLSGILIDIGGRASDKTFLDTLLPPRDVPASH
jgi:hypothetical protein